jgi:hypothetical protein
MASLVAETSWEVAFILFLRSTFTFASELNFSAKCAPKMSSYPEK